MLVQGQRLGADVSNIIWLRGRIASPLVITKLVELGYLMPAKRQSARAVENAIFRLRQRLYHDGIISAGDLSGDFSIRTQVFARFRSCEARKFEG